MDRHKDTLPHLLPLCKKGHFFPPSLFGFFVSSCNVNMQLWIETLRQKSSSIYHSEKKLPLSLTRGIHGLCIILYLYQVFMLLMILWGFGNTTQCGQKQGTNDFLFQEAK